MKSLFKPTIWMAALAFALIALFLLVTAPPAQAQPTTGDGLGLVPGLPATISSATVSNTTSVIRLYNQSGLALGARFNASAGNSNVVVYIKTSVDGTNYASQPWLWTIRGNGTTDEVAVTNWSADTLRGLHSLQISGITNGHASATVTNKGIWFRRPAN